MIPKHIESFADHTFTRLAAADYLRGLDRAEFIDGLTELLGDLNALHPFRDGNGRTQRAFCGQLARHAGHQLRWAPMDPAENITASRASLRGDNTALHIRDASSNQGTVLCEWPSNASRLIPRR